MEIKIGGEPLAYSYEVDDANLVDLTKAVAFMELMKAKLIQEIEDKTKKFEAQKD